MPRSQAGCVYRGHFSGVYELRALTGIGVTTLYRWHSQGLLWEQTIDEELRRRELHAKAKSIGLPLSTALARVARFGWDHERAYATPTRRQA